MTPRPLPLVASIALALLAAACDRDAAAPEPAAPAEASAPATPPPAPAPEPQPDPMPPPPGTVPVDSGATFADMDTNKDGGLTLDELAATEMLHQHFAAADTDGDGRLSALEVDAHRAQMAGSR